MIDENYVKQLEEANEKLRKELEQMQEVQDLNKLLEKDRETCKVFEKAIFHIGNHCYRMQKKYMEPEENVVQLCAIELFNRFPADEDIFDTIMSAVQLAKNRHALREMAEAGLIK